MNVQDKYDQQIGQGSRDSIQMQNMDRSGLGEAVLYSQRRDTDDSSIDTEDPEINIKQIKDKSGGIKKEAPEVSAMTRGMVAIVYMLVSQVLTIVNKFIYSTYKFKSPLNLLMLQCFCNLIICVCLMSYKSYVKKDAYESLQKYGIKISNLEDVFDKTKAKIGMSIGAMNIGGVLLGLYALKFVNIPLLLTNRRCAIFATICVQFILESKIPDSKLVTAAFLMLTGAVIAGYSSLDANYIGYLFVWAQNFAQSFQNVLTAKFNGQKLVSAFEINFFFSLIGLPLMLIITTATGDINTLQQVFMEPAEGMYGLRAMLMVSGCFGFIITMNILLTITLCGPIGMNIAGTMKDVVLTSAGIFFFPDEIILSLSLFIGLGFSFTGASYFSYNKYKDHTEAAKESQKTQIETAVTTPGEKRKPSPSGRRQVGR